MKRLLLLFILLVGFWQAQAKPLNLYEQLCEINQEWRKNRAIAESMGFLNLPPIAGEQNILTFHIETLHKIFRNRDASTLSPTQQQARANNLQNLNEYAQLRDCPRNYYLAYRNPVFIDHEGRYCAVAYLMKQTGKQAFCEAVQQASNFIFIRQITSPEFHAWQHESGFSLDELAWIQPGYKPFVHFIEWDKRDANNKLILLDSAQSVKIYNFDFDRTDMLNLMSFSSDPEYLDKQLKRLNAAYAKVHKPDWNKLQNNGERHIVAMTIFKTDLHVVIDSTWAIYKNKDSTEVEYRSLHTIYKWDKKGVWSKITQLEANYRVNCLFESAGKLYMGGGRETEHIWDEKNETHILPVTYSFLASYNGKEWKVSKEEYGGYVVGLVYKNSKRYLATMHNEWGATRAPINQTKNKGSK